MRPYIMAEYAANGERNLVLTDTLIRNVMRQPRSAKGLRADAEAVGVKFVDAHAPFGVGEDLNVPFENGRSSMLLRFKLAVEIGADFGVDSMTCHVGNTLPEYAKYSLDDLHTCAIRLIRRFSKRCSHTSPRAIFKTITDSKMNIFFPDMAP